LRPPMKAPIAVRFAAVITISAIFEFLRGSGLGAHRSLPTQITSEA
jgi:hypothetical protein